MSTRLAERADKRPLTLQLMEYERGITFRQFVMKHRAEGYKHREISALLGISPPTYYRWLASEGVQRKMEFGPPRPGGDHGSHGRPAANEGAGSRRRLLHAPEGRLVAGEGDNK